MGHSSPTSPEEGGLRGTRLLKQSREEVRAAGRPTAMEVGRNQEIAEICRRICGKGGGRGAPAGRGGGAAEEGVGGWQRK